MSNLLLLIVADKRRKPHSRHDIYKAQAFKAGIGNRRWGENGGVATVQGGLGNEPDSMLKQAKGLFSGGGGLRGRPRRLIKPDRSTSNDEKQK